MRLKPTLLAAAGMAVVLARVVALPDPALPAVFAVALLLGASFVLLEFGFTSGFRALLLDGDARPVGASLVIPAVAALVVIPVAGLAEGYGRYVAPVGLQLVLGAMLFGVGMQVANGCGSGVLVAAGQGSRRMLVALPCFCLGGVLGTLLLPTGAMLPALGSIDLLELLGPWVGWPPPRRCWRCSRSASCAAGRCRGRCCATAPSSACWRRCCSWSRARPGGSPPG